MRVGVLALQGDVREHEAAVLRLGAQVQLLKSPADLDGIDALILPGGESTTMSLLLDSSGLRSPLKAAIDSGLPTLGTCAGLVLLANDVTDGRADQTGIGGLAVTVQRNGFGRQRFSFEAEVAAPDLGKPFVGVFIRAPRIVEVSPDVHVLATLEGEAVACQQGMRIGCSFHPELAGDDRLHQRLLSLV